ncbi:NepR family anti-sigma factor [Rhodobacter lacus]|uniref:NepR family anti-sigma factor n=1 Tax=Rhodobacter lacus TaxID=1641972 RepID=A0ABW5ADP1_9RHOB
MAQEMTEEKGKPALRRDIDENLKRVYEAAIDPEIPDRFKQLLAQLKAQQTGTQNSETEGSR